MLLRKLDKLIQRKLMDKIEINYIALKLLQNDSKLTDKQRADMLTAYRTIDGWAGWVRGTKLMSTFDMKEDAVSLKFSVTYYVPKYKVDKFRFSLTSALDVMNYNWNCSEGWYTTYFVFF